MLLICSLAAGGILSRARFKSFTCDPISKCYCSTEAKENKQQAFFPLECFFPTGVFFSYWSVFSLSLLDLLFSNGTSSYSFFYHCLADDPQLFFPPFSDTNLRLLISRYTKHLLMAVYHLTLNPRKIYMLYLSGNVHIFIFLSPMKTN